MVDDSRTFGLSLDRLDPKRPVHLSGVAGSAMSGLAVILRERGFVVTGTDPDPDAVRARLEAAGVTLYREQDGSRIDPDTQIVVATAAIQGDHPELAAARSRGIEVVKYAEMLGAIMASRDGVAVAGTHGKTTTTAMVVSALKGAGVDAGFMIGGFHSGLNASAGNGAAPLFVAEACEYDRSFLKLFFNRAIVTNIELDHLDVYENLNEIVEAFRTFASRLPSDGALVYSAQCANTARILDAAACRKLSFGVECDAFFSARNVRLGAEGSSFDLEREGEKVAAVRIALPGLFNVANAVACLTLCSDIDVPLDAAADALAGFTGVSRRFDIRGETGGVVVIDDYAHHPTEIRAVLEAAGLRFPDRRIVAVFQPHQISRTRALLEDFAASFSRADLVLVSDIFAARETDGDRGRSVSSLLAERILAAGVESEYAGSLAGTVDRLKELILPGDILLVVGAGDVTKVSQEILERS